MTELELLTKQKSDLQTARDALAEERDLLAQRVAALVFVEGASAEDVVPLLGKTFKLDIDSLAADAPAEEIKLRDAVDGRKTFNRGQCPSVTLASALNARRPGTIPSGEISSHLIDMEAK